MSDAFTVWLFHQGSASNRYYSLHLRQPRVTVREVPSEDGSGMTRLHATPDPFLFNFCLYGFERRLKFKLPLGAVRKLTFVSEEIE